MSAIRRVEERIIEEIKPTQKELRYIKARLAYLESRAKEGYSRIDWANILISTLINIGSSSEERCRRSIRIQMNNPASIVKPGAINLFSI